MNRFTTLLLCCALGLMQPVVTCAEEPPSRLELSLLHAIAMALSRNADLQIEVLNPVIAEKSLAGSYGLYDPFFFANGSGGGFRYAGTRMTREASGSLGIVWSLSTGGSMTASSSIYLSQYPDIAIPDEWTTDLALKFAQPLLRNSGKEATEINITLAGNTLSQSKDNYRFVATDTVYATIVSYNHLYTLQKNLKTREGALVAAQTLLSDLTSKSPVDKIGLANAEYNVAQRRSELVDATREVSDEEARLRYLIGLYDKIEIVVTDPPSREEPPDTEVQAVNKALAFRTDLKQLRSELESTKLQERFARNQALPELYLTTEARVQGEGEIPDDAYRRMHDGTLDSWSAGLLFTMPIGNTSARNYYLQSKLRREQAQQQIEALAWKIRNDVEADMRTLISNRLQLMATQKSLQSAEVRREEYMKNAAKGTATVQNLIDADSDLNSARESYLNALESFANTVAKLWRDTGELLERQGVSIKTSASQP